MYSKNSFLISSLVFKFFNSTTSLKLKGAILKEAYLPESRVDSSPDNNSEFDPV